MLSPRPPAPLGAHDFGSWRPKRKPAAAIPPRPAELISLMTYGAPDGSAPPMTLKEAAAYMGIKAKTATAYFRHPAARAEYLRLVKDLRESEHVRNLNAAVEIRDDATMKESAAGARARVEAMRFIEHRDQDDRRVQVHVGLQIANMPGYRIDVPFAPADIAAELARAGSAAAIETPLIEHDPKKGP